MEKASLLSLIYLRLAIAGDLHGQWGATDIEILNSLKPDALLLVGDFSDGEASIATDLSKLELPVACILGNHDIGNDHSGRKFQYQLDILKGLHCGWSSRQWDIPLSVVGARPGSPGGGFYLSKGVESIYGKMLLEESAERIAKAASKTPNDQPLVILAHCGPSGLGTSIDAPCGRDWQSPSLDWGDQDLELGLKKIRHEKHISLVAFGHMHHKLRQGGGWRRTHILDRWGTSHLNAASVPRHCIDENGKHLHHFAWAEFYGNRLWSLSHRWYGIDGRLYYEQPLLRPTSLNTINGLPFVSC